MQEPLEGLGTMETAPLTPPPQTHCPVYLVNVSSMSAGDVIAAAKMQGRDTGGDLPPSTRVGKGQLWGAENPIDTRGGSFGFGGMWARIVEL